MSESKLSRIVRELLEDLTEDIVEERVVAYIVKELRLGRRLDDILKDPYVGNRVSEEKIGELLQNKEILLAVEQKLNETLGGDFDFGK